MPDHVNVLLSLRSNNCSLPRLIGDLKKWVPRQAAQQGLAVAWQKGFFERVLRSDEDVVTTARYIVANPVRVGLVSRPRDYQWGGSFEWDLWEQ
jgi:putative transposase